MQAITGSFASLRMTPSPLNSRPVVWRYVYLLNEKSANPGEPGLLEEAVAGRFDRSDQPGAVHARGQLLEPSQQPAPDSLPAQITGNIERFYAQSVAFHMPFSVGDDRSGKLPHERQGSCQARRLAGRIALEKGPEGGLILRLGGADEEVLAFQGRASLSGRFVTMQAGFSGKSNRSDS